MSQPLVSYNEYGNNGTPLLILHGLFGSGKNWVSIARSLSDRCHIYTLDARNHGSSFRAESHSLRDMVSDVRHFIQQKNIQNPVLLGHSMGGLTAMALALESPNLIKALIIADIAPRSYSPDYSREFSAQKIDLVPFQNRAEIDHAMQKFIPDKNLRQFLQTNIVTNESGKYQWQIYIEPIERSADRTTFGHSPREYSGPALFLRGLKSSFIQEKDIMLIHEKFPNAQIHEIENADHWLHYSAQPEFLSAVRKFLDTNNL